MSKILVCGICPLPFENTRQSFGPGIRSWQFARGLERAGHEVHLVAMKIQEAYAESPAVREETFEGVRVERLADKEFFDASEIERRLRDLRPDAAVGATVYGSNVLARATPKLPFWADQFGHFMAEAQAKARLEGANWPVANFWAYLEPVLRSADKFSTVSDRQRYALMGELGVIGRLTHETCGYEFTSFVPCALVPRPAEEPRRLLRGTAYPDDAFVVLWSGGYNVWSDVETLFRGLEIAMEQDPRIHFVSTGGEIPGHDERTYQGFRQNVEQSAHRGRYHLQGWVDAELIPSYEAEADLGVLTDVAIYEGQLGSKNRIIQWLGHGLPAVYNAIGDLGDLLAGERLGLTFPPGDASALAREILWASGHRDELREMASRAHTYSRREFSFEATTRGLAEWARDPVRAPDATWRRHVLGPADFAAPPHASADEAAGRDGGDARVTSVIVHHRGQAMLERCLESLLASQGVELEIVVVANHCQEDLPELAHRSPRIHVVASEISLGFSAANNLGVRWAREHLGEADFYYFVNNDTRSFPESLSRLVEGLRRWPRAALAGPKLLILGASDHYNSLGLNITEDAWGWDEGIGIHVEDYGRPPQQRNLLSVTGSALLIDAEVFLRIDGWTEIYEFYFEDTDLGLKVWKSGHQVVHVPDAVVLHQISATMSEGSERKVFFFWRNRLLLALIHWPFGLLWATLRRARRETAQKLAEGENLPSDAMKAAWRLLPAALRLRWRHRGPSHWRRFLVPPGSTPVITLPELGADEDPAPGILRAPPLSGHRPANLNLDQRGAEELEELYRQTRGELERIHRSKMWRFWMLTIALRQRLTRPFASVPRETTSP